MAKNYSYPRVTISQYAKTRSNVSVIEDTTVLFMPFIAEKGPIEEKEYHPIHTLEEFIEKFGDSESMGYENNGQTALNIYNWLSNGGTLFPYRLNNYENIKSGKASLTSFGLSVKVGEETTTKTFFEAKYLGKYYDNLLIYIGNGKVQIYKGKDLLESYKAKDIKTLEKLLDASNLIELKFNEHNDGEESKCKLCEVLTNSDIKKLEVTACTGIVPGATVDSLLGTFWKPSKTGNDYGAYNVLANELGAPVDLIMDAGYSEDVKKAMIEFISNHEDEATKEVLGVRPDIVGLFDSYYHDTTEPKDSGIFKTETEDLKHATNIAVWTQYFTVSDEIFTGKDIKVTPTYFLSKLIPYNDITYGVQYPVAGLKRGILDDVKAVNENPLPDEKNTYFTDRINYVEKTPREYAFMSQRTWDGTSEEEFTSLSFLNNVRALERMKKDLTRYGREYLFEHNDAVTLAQMSNVLNKYMNNWVANRTLSYAKVDVTPYANENDLEITETVYINLTIRFNNTIEVISVDIVIE